MLVFYIDTDPLATLLDFLDFMEIVMDSPMTMPTSTTPMVTETGSTQAGDLFRMTYMRVCGGVNPGDE